MSKANNNRKAKEIAEKALAWLHEEPYDVRVESARLLRMTERDQFDYCREHCAAYMTTSEKAARNLLGLVAKEYRAAVLYNCGFVCGAGVLAKYR